MRKKQKYLFGFVLLLVYTISVCGVTINKHFCGGELESVSFLKQSSCCGGDMEDEGNDGCCADESIYISNKTEGVSQTTKVAVNSFYTVLQTVITPVYNQVIPLGVTVSRLLLKGKPPALSEDNLSYLMVFRI